MVIWIQISQQHCLLPTLEMVGVVTGVVGLGGSGFASVRSNLLTAFVITVTHYQQQVYSDHWQF